MTLPAARSQSLASIGALIDRIRQLELALDDGPDDLPVAAALRTNALDVESEARAALAAPSLAAMQHHMQSAARVLFTNVAAHRTIDALFRAARTPSMRRWCDVVTDTIERCEHAALAAGDALACCLDEIAETSGETRR